MSTIREQIIAATIQRLNTDRPVGIPAAAPMRASALNRDELDAITVYRVHDAAADVHSERSPIRERELEVAIECWVKEVRDENGEVTVPADAATEPLVAWVVKALTDQTLSGLVHYSRELETNWSAAVGEAVYCLATVSWLFKWQHRAGDLELLT